MLPDEIRPAMEGIVPSFIGTCSLDGIPNGTIISQVYYVDATHVALSHQFFNKTLRNAHANPQVTACVVDPETFQNWLLRLRFDHTETEGPVFDDMEMKIEAIASMTGMSGIFALKGADIYEVVSVAKANNRV